MQLIQDFTHEYPGHSSKSSGKCRIRKYNCGPDQADVVIISSVPGHIGTSITNRIEHICEELREPQPAAEPIWIEHYPKGDGMKEDTNTYAYVTFDDQGSPH